MKTKLIYTNPRGDSIINVPPRDLTDEDFAEREELWKENGITEEILIERGLYEKTKAEQPKPVKAAKEGK